MFGRLVLIEGVTSEQRLEEAEKVSHVAFWEKHSHRREQPVQRLGVFEEQQGWQCGWSRGPRMGNEERGAGEGKESLLIRGLGNRVPAKC